jgi:hypothetical protein
LGQDKDSWCVFRRVCVKLRIFKGYGKFRSGNYSFAQKVELKEEYKELENSLKKNLTKEMAEFRSSYYDALTKRNSSKIDQLENSLLSNLLSKI